MSSRQTRTSGRPAARRLPKHRQLDYILIPAPEDLSLLSVTEKSPLPTIIVTPSSPSSTKDFSIAFLAPPKKPTLRERISQYFFPKTPTEDPASSPPPAYASLISTRPTSPWRDTWNGWVSAVNPPIALPITSPISGSAPRSWHTEAPASTTRRTRLTVLSSLVFLLVFCHVFTHYISASAGLPFKGMSEVGTTVETATVGSGEVAVKHSWSVDWQGWFSFDYGRAAMKHSGASFVTEIPLEETAKLVARSEV